MVFALCTFQSYCVVTYNFYTRLLSYSGPASEAVDHPAGNHTYPFSLNLPHTLPSSFEGRKGYVRYFCKATIDRPWKFDSHTKRAFTVIHHLDLNMQPNSVVYNTLLYFVFLLNDL